MKTLEQKARNNARMKAGYPAKRDAILAYQKRLYAANPEIYRERNLKRKYGITVADWNRMFELQGRACVICRRSNGKWAVDHHHDTDKVRAILCTDCNHLLGQARENPDTLRAAADYLELFQESLNCEHPLDLIEA